MELKQDSGQVSGGVRGQALDATCGLKTVGWRIRSVFDSVRPSRDPSALSVGAGSQA